MRSGSDEKNYVAACFASEGIEWWGLVWWAFEHRRCRDIELARDDDHGRCEDIKPRTRALSRFDRGELDIAAIATRFTCSRNFMTGSAFVGGFDVEVAVGTEAKEQA
jgi:hypothetical protein